MSYILDALKKSDQQRQQGNGPSIQTIHRPVAIRNDSPLLKWILLILLALLIGFGSVLIWYFKQGDIASTVVSGEVPVTKDPSRDVTTAQLPIKNSSVDSVSQTQVDKIQLNEVAIRFNDLDAVTRNAIPSLTFSFHVYSDNPARRTIIINSRRVGEGAFVESGLMLEEITPLGVIFIWQNEVRFSIDVVESW